MRDFKKSLTGIWQEDKKIIVLMALVLLMALILLVFSLARLDLSGSLVKIGYGDLTGYKQGSWSEMLVFALVAVLFGVLHNLLALKMFKKHGADITKMFLVLTICLIFAAFLVLMRLSSGA